SLLLTLDVRPISAEDTVPIRHTVLWPHIPADSDIIRLPEDDEGYHFGAFLRPEDASPVAVISLFRESVPPGATTIESQPHSQWRFRKFACLQMHQGKGIGTRLLADTRAYARDQFGAAHLWCDARASAAVWYERKGFQKFGGAFFKHGVEYVRMIVAA
ncbi:acyl-CoA N-acyltransferase, partial [Vararia minispora EC-137]